MDDDEITIPVLEISGSEWTVDDIETLEDCDDAFAYLTSAIVKIENRMDDMTDMGQAKDESFRKTRAALRFKKAALQVVQTKRGTISRQDKQRESKSWALAFEAWCKSAHPDVFEEFRRESA